MKFINPYHFVPPLAEPVSPVSKTRVVRTLVQVPSTGTTFQPDVPELLHDRYLPPEQLPTFSGRMTCTLTTASPCVFGNQHRTVTVDGQATTVVENFQIDQKAAIQATTLKGMLSSLAELASGSAMRVLGNHALSMRSSMRQSRSAVGMIIERTVQEANHTVRKRFLLPLTLPNFSWDRGQRQFMPVGRSGTNKVWHTLIKLRSSLGTMPVYVRRNCNQSLCFHPQFAVVELPDTYRSQIAWDNRNQRPSDRQPVEAPFVKLPGPLLRPVKRRGAPVPTPTLSSAKNPGTFQGILRSLARPDGNKDSTFDLFIPIEPDWISDQHTFDFSKVDQKLLLDAEVACRNFDAVVAHPLSTAKKTRPATELRGQAAFKQLDKLRTHTMPPQLKQGDLVFFTPSASGCEVDSLSISAIWRDGVRWLWNEHTRDYSLLHHPDQRPISAMREQITMAEKLFGWVLEGVSDQDEQSQDELPNGYRGRVTITDARSEETLRDAQLTNGDNRDNTELSGYFPMPILGTPKLPCPEFYFRGGSNWIRQELMTGGDTSTRIQGWKFYVVDKSTLRNNEPKRWKTAHPERDLKQKSWVRPVKCGTQFTFQVRFNQLTLLEYQLLCYAIQPAAQYSHRVGYGKPLGLGVVQLQTDRAELMNYSKRYREDRDLLTNSATWTLDDQTVADRAQEFAKLIKDHHKLIVAAGLPQEIDVSYPITQQQQRIETELYRWFVANRHTDGSVQQRLQPLDDQGLDEKGLIKPLNK